MQRCLLLLPSSPWGSPLHPSPLKEPQLHPQSLGTPISQDRALSQFIWALGSAGSGQHTYTTQSHKEAINNRESFYPMSSNQQPTPPLCPQCHRDPLIPTRLSEHSPQRLPVQYRGSLWGSGLLFKDKTLPEQEHHG